MPVIPISRHRAWSHIRNPRVSEDDVILVLAMVEGKMAGYLGVLADYIYLNGQKEKAGWLSCMWVDPEVRGQGIAKKLLNRVLERWDNRILVTEFTPAAKGLYDRSQQFQDLKISEGLRGFLRFNLDELLPKKFPALEKWTRAPLLLGCRPSPASITPAFASSSLYLPMSASSFSSGIAPSMMPMM